MTEPEEPVAPVAKPEPTVATVEAMVRRQMATALGGKRGIIEAAVPGIFFTVIYLITKNVAAALIVSLASAAVALVLRLIARSTLQYVGNAFFSVAIGWVFVHLAARGGGSKSDQALAYFLPGLIVSSVLIVVMVASNLVGWPFLGFMLGSVTGDPTAWHADRQVVQLCSRLTWLYIVPSIIGVGLQGPVYLLGRAGTIDVDLAILLLGILRLGLGWPLRIGAWGAMIWLLARDRTPLDGGPTSA